LILTLVFAQHRGPSSGAGPDREDAKMIKKWKLIEFLDISEDQSGKFFTRINTFEKDMKSIRKKEKELRKSIHEFMDGDKLNEAKVSRLMDEYFQFESERLDLRRKHHEDIGDILSPKQTVKYMVFDHHFKKRIKEHLKDRKGGGNRKRF
jgi:Spy/CpxP family protein refolding chaperone